MTDDFSEWPEAYVYNGTRYVRMGEISLKHGARATEKIIGLIWDEWDGSDENRPVMHTAYLPSRRLELTYCGCSTCDGHDNWVEIPEAERYWQPDPRPWYMPVLEDQPSQLMRFVNQLGRKR